MTTEEDGEAIVKGFKPGEYTLQRRKRQMVM
ncbi:hypothetical protein ACEQPO_06290 [Bacillus sp. SL00103]